MSEAINHHRIAKGLTPRYLMTHSEAREAYTKRAAALLRLNGYTPNGYNPHNVRAWGIYNEYGILAIAIGSHEQEALDNAVDNDCMDSCLVEESERDEDHASLGNAGEPFDLSYISMTELAPL